MNMNWTLKSANSRDHEKNNNTSDARLRLTSTAPPIRRCLCQYHSSNGHCETSSPGYNRKSNGDGIITSSTAATGNGTDSSSLVRCSVCINQILQPYILRHERALKDHADAKATCERRLRQIPAVDTRHKLSELQAESQFLRDRLEQLRGLCGDVAVRVAAQAVENDTHREESRSSFVASRQRQTILGLEQSLLDGSLQQSIQTSRQTVRILRFQWARKVFSMYRLYIDPDDIKPTPLQQKRVQQKQQLKQQQQQQRHTTKDSGDGSSQSQNPSSSITESQRKKVEEEEDDDDKDNTDRTVARGIAKIAGLPLPNAGFELYGVLPPSELVSALRLVASLTQTLSRTLGIILPHPIFLTMNCHNSNAATASTTSASTSTINSGGSGGDITGLISDEDLRRYRNQQFGKHRDDDLLSSPFQVRLHNTTEGDTASNPSQTNDQNRYLHNPFSSSSNMVGGGGGSSAAPYGTSSTSSLMSLMDGAYWTTKAKKALAKATGHHSKTANHQASHATSSSSGSTATGGGTLSSSTSMTTFIPPSTDATIVAQRIQHATGVIIADSDDSQDHHHHGGSASPSAAGTSSFSRSGGGGGSGASRFALSIETMNQDEFAIALQFLQNDVMNLCIRAGVPVSKLWPAEAMLLNLHELALFCQQQTAVTF